MSKIISTERLREQLARYGVPKANINAIIEASETDSFNTLLNVTRDDCARFTDRNLSDLDMEFIAGMMANESLTDSWWLSLEEALSRLEMA